MNQRCFEVLAAYEIRGKKNTCQKLLKNISKKTHRLGVLNYKSAKVSSEICSIKKWGFMVHGIGIISQNLAAITHCITTAVLPRKYCLKAHANHSLW